MFSSVGFHLHEVSKTAKLRSRGKHGGCQVLGRGRNGKMVKGTKLQLYKMNKFERSAVQRCVCS